MEVALASGMVVIRERKDVENRQRGGVSYFPFILVKVVIADDDGGGVDSASDGDNYKKLANYFLSQLWVQLTIATLPQKISV